MSYFDYNIYYDIGKLNQSGCLSVVSRIQTISTAA
jgi:hypothetical protein